MVINGTGFGADPGADYMSDFRTATVGNDLPTAGVQGSMSLNASYPSKGLAGGLNGGVCGTGRHVAGGVHSAITVDWVEPATKYFVQYAYKIPAGHYFPSKLSPAPETFPNDSCLKMLWGKDGNQVNDNDLVIFTHNSGPGSFKIYGNDYNYFNPDGGETPAPWWEWDEWMIFTIEATAGADPKVDNGTFYIKITTPTQVHVYTKTDAPLYDPDGAPAQTTRQVLNGWQRPEDPDGPIPQPCQQMVDQFHVNHGALSQNRVEIGNNANYDLARTVAQKFNSWSSEQIVIDTYGIELGDLGAEPDLWVFVTVDGARAVYKYR